MINDETMNLKQRNITKFEYFKGGAGYLRYTLSCKDGQHGHRPWYSCDASPSTRERPYLPSEVQPDHECHNPCHDNSSKSPTNRSVACPKEETLHPSHLTNWVHSNARIVETTEKEMLLHLYATELWKHKA